MKKLLGIGITVIGIATVITGLILKANGQMSVSVIGGADGPTSIFVAGKVGSTSAVAGIVAGIVLIAAGIFMIVKMVKKK